MTDYVTLTHRVPNGTRTVTVRADSLIDHPEDDYVCYLEPSETPVDVLRDNIVGGIVRWSK